jgi:hypothetical protein
MPTFIAATNDGTEVAAVIALDDDQAREMVTEQFKSEDRLTTLKIWQSDGMILRMDKKDPGEFEHPRSLF